MSKNNQPHELLHQLDRAVARATEEGADVPAPTAMSRAGDLLRMFVSTVIDPALVEVFVADDGTIEITARPGDRFVTVDVAPRSGRTAIVVQDKAGNVLLSNENASEVEVINQVACAA